MKILTVDIGTGTQDIFLYDSHLELENGYKLVVPSPTMIIFRRLQEATRRREAVLLTGVTMGGGPSQWAAEAHLRAGLPLYATPSAARSFDDDLQKVQSIGIQVISEDEVDRLSTSTLKVELRDFDFTAITNAFGRFGVSLKDLSAIAVAVFDHGNAPPGYSDRQFRFDYLDERIRAKNRLSAFAYRAEDVPQAMTRLQAVVDSAGCVDAPLIVMDTAPAAVLGATYDPKVSRWARKLIVNVGNFHTLAFRLAPDGIEGVFEHHTGLIDLPKLENLIRSLADGSIRHADVFEDQGHGALVYDSTPMPLKSMALNIAVTGPRRNIFRKNAGQTAKEGGAALTESRQTIIPYFSAPFGDMMIVGCFGLLASTADLLPEVSEPLRASLAGSAASSNAPWDVVEVD